MRSARRARLLGRPPPLDREPLAALVATALEDDATGTRLHARPEAVRAGALALLGLVGALHVGAPRGLAGPRTRQRRVGPRRVTGAREDTRAALHSPVHTPSTACAQAVRTGPPKILARFAGSSRTGSERVPAGLGTV